MADIYISIQDTIVSVVQTGTLQKVRAILEERAVGLGIPIAALRRLYPARQVRRPQIMEAIHHFEDLATVTGAGGRVRWTGPFARDARPFGIPVRRIERDATLTPQERVRLMAELSEAFLRKTRAP